MNNDYILPQINIKKENLEELYDVKNEFESDELDDEYSFEDPAIKYASIKPINESNITKRQKSNKS